MPHITIQAIKGATQEQIEQACKKAILAASAELNKPLDVFSASFEEFERSDWDDMYKSTVKPECIIVKKGDCKA